MSTAQINAQIFQQLSLIADNESCLQKTLDFLKSLTKGWNLEAKTVSRVEYSRLIKQLSDYQEYEYDWDGDGASPLEKESVKNVKKVLEEADDDLLKGWRIEPEVNGTILFISPNNDSTINLGNKAFTYYIKKGKNIEGENSVRFAVNKVVGVLKQYQNVK